LGFSPSSLGFLIAGPIFYRALRRTQRAVELIAPKGARGNLIGEPDTPALAPADDAVTEPDTGKMDSVVEQTTLELKPPRA
jgi:hypothetical protein